MSSKESSRYLVGLHNVVAVDSFSNKIRLSMQPNLFSFVFLAPNPVAGGGGGLPNDFHTHSRTPGTVFATFFSPSSLWMLMAVLYGRDRK